MAGRAGRDEGLAAALAAGQSVKAAAQAAGLCERSVYRRMARAPAPAWTEFASGNSPLTSAAARPSVMPCCQTVAARQSVPATASPRNCTPEKGPSVLQSCTKYHCPDMSNPW